MKEIQGVTFLIGNTDAVCTKTCLRSHIFLKEEKGGKEGTRSKAEEPLGVVYLAWGRKKEAEVLLEGKRLAPSQ